MLRHRRKHNRAYGVIWDESTSTPACVRIGQGASAPVSSALPANLAIIQSLMRGCVFSDAGVVQYYLDPTTRTLKENGDPANLDGSDGQVMVEIPLAWLKYDYQNNQHTQIIRFQSLFYWISLCDRSDFSSFTPFPRFSSASFSHIFSLMFFIHPYINTCFCIFT